MRRSVSVLEDDVLYFLLYNTKESDYSKLAVKTQTSNILFLFSCGIKCIAGSWDLKYIGGGLQEDVVER